MTKGRILWVDDEVDLLRPHTLLLIREGYHVDAVMNGADALELLELENYDLILLDEQMPGLRGLDVLSAIRTAGRDLPIVMVTKSEADETLHEALGRRADDYIIKPTSPRQVLSVVTRLLAGPRLRHQQAAREFTERFGELRDAIIKADSWEDWAALYSELVDWDLRLEEAGRSEPGRDDRSPARRHQAELQRTRGRALLGVAAGGGRGRTAALRRYRGALLRPAARRGPVRPAGGHRLPAARPVASDPPAAHRPVRGRRGPLFVHSADGHRRSRATPSSAGCFADEIEESRPGWYDAGSESGYNTFEDELFASHIEELVGPEVRTHYEKVFSADQGNSMLQRLGGYLSGSSATALVFGFVDLLTHGRSESRLIWEVARDAPALRSLTYAWFERSAAFGALKEAARRGVPVLLTTDHGSVHCNRPLTIYAHRDATAESALQVRPGHAGG